MTPAEAAAKLDGNQYREEGSPEFFAEMKAAGLVAIYGASDDLMEINGAAYDEIGAWNGGKVLFTKDGILDNRCTNERCPYHAAESHSATEVRAIWDDGGFSWRYETEIPHAKFVIKEDDENYCEGIVFALADVPRSPQVTEGTRHE
jgi:hypothetical protein